VTPAASTAVTKQPAASAVTSQSAVTPAAADTGKPAAPAASASAAAAVTITPAVSAPAASTAVPSTSNPVESKNQKPASDVPAYFLNAGATPLPTPPAKVTTLSLPTPSAPPEAAAKFPTPSAPPERHETKPSAPPERYKPKPSAPSLPSTLELSAPPPKGKAILDLVPHFVDQVANEASQVRPLMKPGHEKSTPKPVKMSKTEEAVENWLKDHPCGWIRGRFVDLGDFPGFCKGLQLMKSPWGCKTLNERTVLFKYMLITTAIGLGIAIAAIGVGVGIGALGGALGLSTTGLSLGVTDFTKATHVDSELRSMLSTATKDFQKSLMWRWVNVHGRDLDWKIRRAKFAINSPFVFPFIHRTEVVNMMSRLAFGVPEGKRLGLVTPCFGKGTFRIFFTDSGWSKERLDFNDDRELLDYAIENKFWLVCNIPWVDCEKSDLRTYLKTILPDNRFKEFRREMINQSERTEAHMRAFTCGMKNYKIRYPSIPNFDGKIHCTTRQDWMLDPPFLTQPRMNELSKQHPKYNEWISRAFFQNGLVATNTWWIHWLGELSAARLEREIPHIIAQLNHLLSYPSFQSLFFPPELAKATLLRSPRDTAVITLDSSLPLHLRIYYRLKEASDTEITIKTFQWPLLPSPSETPLFIQMLVANIIQGEKDYFLFMVNTLPPKLYEIENFELFHREFGIEVADEFNKKKLFKVLEEEQERWKQEPDPITDPQTLQQIDLFEAEYAARNARVELAMRPTATKPVASPERDDDSLNVLVQVSEKVVPDDAKRYCRVNFPKHPYAIVNKDHGTVLCGTEFWMVEPGVEEYAEQLNTLLTRLLDFKNLNRWCLMLHRWLEGTVKASDMLIKKIESDRFIDGMDTAESKLSMVIDLCRSHRLFVGIIGIQEAEPIARFYPDMVVMFLHWAEPGQVRLACFHAAKNVTEWKTVPIKDFASPAKARIKMFELFQGRISASSYGFMHKRFGWMGTEHRYDPILYWAPVGNFRDFRDLRIEMDIKESETLVHRWKKAEEQAFLQQVDDLSLEQVDLYHTILKWESRWNSDSKAGILVEMKTALERRRSREHSEAERLEVDVLCREPRVIHYLRSKYQKKFPHVPAYQVQTMSRSAICSSWLGSQIDYPILVSQLDSVPSDLVDHRNVLDLYNEGKASRISEWLMHHYGVNIDDMRRYNPKEGLKNVVPRVDVKNDDDALKRLVAFKYLLRHGAGNCSTVPKQWCEHEVAKDVCTWSGESHVCRNVKEQGWTAIGILDALIHNLCASNVPLGRGDLMVTLEMEHLFKQTLVQTREPVPESSKGFVGHCSALQELWKVIRSALVHEPLTKWISSYSLQRFWTEEHVAAMLRAIDPAWSEQMKKRVFRIPPVATPIGPDMSRIRCVAFVLYRLHFYRFFDLQF
jgi:hypothetical protein